MRALLAAVIAAGASASASAQDTTATTLDPVVVTVTRGSGRTVLGSPFAITVTQPDSARPGQRKSSFDESLSLIPGLTSVSRNNPSQDPRLSIRGFGARSAFGVRGIRVVRDGIPITLPDGQTPLDYVSLESVGRIEVLRGAASALYGNASGGVIDLRSTDPSVEPIRIEAKQWLGSDAMSRSVVSASGTSGPVSYLGDASYSRSDGARDHSRQRGSAGFAKISTEARGTRYSLAVMAYDNPLSENPGALTIDEMRVRPEMADALSVRRDAKKMVNQFQAGLSAVRLTSRTEISLSGFGGARSLDNPLTFAVVEVGRHSWGTSGAVRSRREAFRLSHSLTAGFDAQWQNDLRRNFAVCADTIVVTAPTPTCPIPGDDRGVVTLDQRELVSSVGVYAGDDIQLDEPLTLAIGIRADRVRFEVKDRLVSGSNPDDSGDRNLGAVSPVIGLLFRIAPSHSLYANLSSAFETPTATELGNHEDGSAGINEDLDPQKSWTMEVGAKGAKAQWLRYDASLYDTRVRDELVPFEIPASNGRRYFRNAGRTRRRGAELGGEVSLAPLSLMVAYSYSHFRFDKYSTGGQDYSGNEIPGVPSHRFQTALRIQRRQHFAAIESEVAGRSFADDANTFRVSGYSASNARFGTAAYVAGIRFSLVGGIQNLFDRVYASSIAVNAGRGKYFEPAARRSVFAGASIATR